MRPGAIEPLEHAITPRAEPRSLSACRTSTHGGTPACSRTRTQSGTDDGDEAVDRGPGRQLAGCGEGVQAVAGQFVGGDVVA